jgi:glutamate carboxypeptidase
MTNSSTQWSKLDIEDEVTLIKKLEDLVNIRSISRDAKANDAVQAIVKKDLEALGFAVELIDHETHPEEVGKLLVAELKGESEKFVTMVAHADTVEASTDFVGFNLCESGRYAYGPGVIDDKGGLIVAIQALKAFLAQEPKPHLSIRFISSPAEETGSADFHKHLKQYGKSSRIILGYEPALPGGNIIDARAGNRWYEITITGRAAHSGRNYQHGVNAVDAMSTKLLQLSALTDVDAGTTVSVTNITGGNDTYNTVAGSCVAHVDSRFLSQAEDDRLKAEGENILNTVNLRALDDRHPEKTAVTIIDYSPAITLQEDDLHIRDYFFKAVKHLERKDISATYSHGSSDCNLMLLESDAVFLDGLGAVGADMHTDKEKILLSSLTTRSKANAYLLLYLNDHYKDRDSSQN